MCYDLFSRDVCVVAVVVVVVVLCEMLYGAFVVVGDGGGVNKVVVCGGVCVGYTQSVFGEVVVCM